MRKILSGLVVALALVVAAFFEPAATNQVSLPAAIAQAPVTRAPAGATLPANTDVLVAVQTAVESVYQNVSPSVVYIEVTEGSAAQTNNSVLPRFRQPLPQVPQQGSGSGFVWDKEGRIVTNNHVVDGATSIQVTFGDGTIVPAKVIATDPNSDLAVIQVSDPADELHPVTLADSTQVKVGQIAIAIGNPFGLENTLTVGYVSGVGRSLPTGSGMGNGPTYAIPDVIQTDAPINPGNSGGVLLDINGQVVGVTNAIVSDSGSSSGVGFAIPAATVAKVIPALITTGHYAYSWLGISGGTLTPDIAQAMNLKSDQRGVLINSVTAGGPADKAGLRGGDHSVALNGNDVLVGGDVIVAINGQSVNNFDAVVTYLTRNTAPGQDVTLTIIRGGQQQQVTVTLGERPATQSGQ